MFPEVVRPEYQEHSMMANDKTTIWDMTRIEEYTDAIFVGSTRKPYPEKCVEQDSQYISRMFRNPIGGCFQDCSPAAARALLGER